MQVKETWLQWLASGDTGISSKTMLYAITGIPATNYYDVPADMDDIGRCVRMLRALPDLRSQLQKVIDKFPHWMPFIDCWKELERGYDECIAYYELPEEEKKKLKRQKHYESPFDRYWKLMQELNCASRYLRGLRIQNCSSSWSDKAPKEY